MNRLLLIVTVIFTLSRMVFAQEITLGAHGESVIAKQGQTTTGCPEEIPDNQKLTIGGAWLALGTDEIRPVKLYVSSSGVSSDKSDELYFFKDIPILAGKIVNGHITLSKINSTARSEYEVRLGALRYRFIEWGAGQFALQTLSPKGNIIKTHVFGTETGKIPPHVYQVTQEARDHYEPGTLSLLKAADFNADGKVDLLLEYWSKEAGGLTLLLSNPKAENYAEPYVSATVYSDCG